MTGSRITTYYRRIPKRGRAIAATSLYGTLAGLAAVAFHLAIHGVYSVTYGRLAGESTGTFFVGSFAVIMSTSLLVGYLLNHFCIDARGSGIPQLKLAFWKDFGFVPWRVVWVKFITGILIVFEMTHEFSLVPALMLGSLVSHAISLKLSRHNFYETILVQDGHNLDHVIPPRDLQSWHQLPVSAIASFQPVIVPNLRTDTLGLFLKKHPYHFFPVVSESKLLGILSRVEAEAALRDRREPILQKAETCLPHTTVKELQFKLIDSASGTVLLLDRPMGEVLGIITLHDLLRAEVSLGKGEAA